MNSQLNPNTLLAERCVAHIVFVAKIVYPRGARSGVNKFHTLNELQIQYPLTLIQYRLSSTRCRVEELILNIQNDNNLDNSDFEIYLEDRPWSSRQFL